MDFKVGTKVQYWEECWHPWYDNFSQKLTGYISRVTDSDYMVITANGQERCIKKDKVQPFTEEADPKRLY